MANNYQDGFNDGLIVGMMQHPVFVGIGTTHNQRLHKFIVNVSAGTEITFYSLTIHSINGTISWGDGTAEEYDSSNDYKHTYSSAGEKMIIVDCNIVNMNHYGTWPLGELTQVQIGNGVTSMSSGMFYKCPNLVNVKLPDSLKKMENDGTPRYGPFSICNSISTITIPPSLTSYSYAFKECSKLETVNISDGCTIISDYAFSGSKNIKYVHIPVSVVNIGYVFIGLYSNLTIYYSGTVDQWNSISKDPSAFKNTIATVICTDGTITING